jgi:hypothetical protein
MGDLDADLLLLRNHSIVVRAIIEDEVVQVWVLGVGVRERRVSEGDGGLMLHAISDAHVLAEHNLRGRLVSWST